MRIVHVITRLIIGGAQENTILTCEDLQKTFGDQVLLLAGPGLGPEGSLVDDARGRGVRLVLIPSLRRAIHPWRDPQSYSALKHELRAFQPDVVHTHSGKAGLFGRLAAWSLGVDAVVHTVHGAPFHKYQNWPARRLFRTCERFAARRCHHLVSVADAMTDQLVAAHVASREKFTTVYSGMEVEPFLEADRHRQETREKFGFEPHHVVVGKVARLFHLKGHADVIAAAAQCVKRQPNLRFLLVGDGILRKPFEREIAAANMQNYFRFAGLVRPDRVPAMIGAMDIVVHASYREGLARVLPQALIAGKPVVSYDVDGAREVVIDNETGCLLRPGDVDGMVRALDRLASDAELRARLGKAGRERFTEPFRHEHMTERLRAIYRDILQGRAVPARQGELSRRRPAG